MACYGEGFDEELSKEAHTIINGWEGRELTLTECEVIEYLNSLEAHSWSNWDVE